MKTAWPFALLRTCLKAEFASPIEKIVGNLHPESSLHMRAAAAHGDGHAVGISFNDGKSIPFKIADYRAVFAARRSEAIGDLSRGQEVPIALRVLVIYVLQITLETGLVRSIQGHRQRHRSTGVGSAIVAQQLRPAERGQHVSR